MESVDCFRDPPFLFRFFMHFGHFFSFPIYIATLIVLVREPSKAFQTYKYYIIVHIIINILTEFYVAYLMFPDTYLPYPVLRMIGYMAQWGFSGLSLFYINSQFIIFIGHSIMEMFYYRFKVCVVFETKSFYANFLKFQIYSYRCSQAFHPIVTIGFFKYGYDGLVESRNMLWNSDPINISSEVKCDNVMTSTPSAVFQWIIVSYYIIQTMNVTIVAIGTVLYISNFVKKNLVMSKNTVRLQLMLIFSLFIQAAVHAVLIFIPICVTMYALFFKISDNRFARIIIIFFTYHGIASTCAMIVFTKPLRDKIIPFIKYIKLGKPEHVSIVAPSSTHDNSRQNVNVNVPNVPNN